MTDGSTHPTHAGSVAFRYVADGPLFLIVSSSNNMHWVLPKGHIDPGETPEQAALRELEEEAGVIGLIRDRLAAEPIDRGGRRAQVQYFLIEYQALCRPRERRICRWEKAGSAAELLSFESSRDILVQAANRLAPF